MPPNRRTKRTARDSKKIRAADLTNAKPVSAAPVIKPQLATAADAVPTGNHWLHEIKFDGYRLLCYLHKGRVRLITRGGHDWTLKFKEVAEALSELKLNDAILDGELIAIGPQGRATFGALQNAVRSSRSRQLQLHLFDVPYCDGIDLRRTPLVERKALLQQLLQTVPDDRLHFSDHVIGHGDQLFENACHRGLEGTISKRVDGEYVSTRTTSWLKNKCKRRQEFVIGGFSEPEGTRSGFGALVVGYYDGERLIYCGRVGTGFSQSTLKDLYGKLRTIEQRQTAFAVPPTGADAKRVHWVKPELVAEIEFGEWTSDGRLRQPAFLGLRADKAPTDVVREQTIHIGPSVKPSSKANRVVSTSGGGVQIGGVTISNPDRVVYPEPEVSKRMLAEYYESIADQILPHIVNRPLTIVRCPKGLPSKCFYQRHVNESLPSSVRGVNVREGDEVVRYIVIDDLKGLISLVQLSTLEIHPWGSTADDIERPDRLIFDLDPALGVPWKRVIEAAMTVRDILTAAKLKSFVQTSGGKGLHVIVPIVPRADWDEAKAFCKAVAVFMASREPKKYTAILSKSRRQEKIFIDYLRNGRGATSVATYSSRARPNAAVATPLQWEELSVIRVADVFTINNLRKRLKSRRSDPWAEYFSVRQQLPHINPNG